jgi:FixJ family two-component response regulator
VVSPLQLPLVGCCTAKFKPNIYDQGPISVAKILSHVEGNTAVVRFHGERLSDERPEIILVEDDPSVLRALRRLLKVSGFKVIAFVRPTELQAAGVPKNACLVFDVYLPEMTGVELYQALVASGCRCPLILITAHVDDATSAITKSVNAAAVLIKPFSRDSLLAAIRKSLAPGAGANCS